MSKPPKKKRPSGAAHMKKAGKVAIYLGVSADEMAIIDAACAIEKRTRANFFAHHAVEAARRIVGERS
jgi:uncharacterized protein (DUF1778 family)